jgi:hypothetical protein
MGVGGEKAYGMVYLLVVFFPSIKQTKFCLASKIAELKKKNKVHEVSFKFTCRVVFPGYKGIFLILWGFTGISYNVLKKYHFSL